MATNRLSILAVGALLAVNGCNGCEVEPVQQLTVQLSARPSQVDFGGIPLAARMERTVAIINEGTARFSPTSPGTVEGDGFSLLQGCDDIPARGACEVLIAFAPAATGPMAGSFAIQDAAGESLRIALVGVGLRETLTVAPNELDFGDVDVGQRAFASFWVDNTGEVPIRVALTLTGRSFVTTAAGELVFEPGTSRDIDLGFAPDSAGAATGVATLEVCGPGCGPQVQLTGRGIQPRIVVDPAAVDFGAVQLGGTARAALVVRNEGTGAAAVRGLRLFDPSGDLVLDAPPLPLALDGGDVIELDVAFTPTRGRMELGAFVVVASSDPVTPEVIVPLRGQSPGPGVDIVPRTVSFGFVDPGQSVTVEVQILSVGTTVADILDVRVEGAGFDLPLHVPPLALLPGEALRIPIEATSDAAAARAGGSAGRLLVEAAGLATETAALSFSAGQGGCQPRAAPANVDLGAVRIGQGGRGQVFVENVGDGVCTLRSAQPAPGMLFDTGFVFATAGITELPPRTAAPVEFGFSPSSTGAHSAFLLVEFEQTIEGTSEQTSEQTHAQLLLSATGRGIRGGLVGVPPTLTLGPTPVGCPVQPRNAMFLNDGSQAVVLSSVALVSPQPFGITHAALPRVLPPSGTAVIQVTADNGGQPGVQEGELRAQTDDGQDAVIRLRLVLQQDALPIVETFLGPEAIAVDVLFVVDNSGSMEDDQRRLAENFSAFFAAALTNPALDFQVGITTTDVLQADAARGRLIGNPSVLVRTTPALEQTFMDHVLVGTEGTGAELGLEAIRLALEAPDNTQFFRPPAALSVVIISDEDDSGDSPLLPDPALARPPEDYVLMLQAMKAGQVENAPVVVSGVLTPENSARYQTVVDALGGITLDITSSTWGEDLSRIGGLTFALGRSFRLANEPGAVVSVTVDGMPASYTVDAEHHVVTLDAPAPPGAAVAVTYQAQCP